MSRRPRLADLYCCQGGAAVGYQRAGFDVIGIDINPQPRYPYEFHQGDALEFLAEHGHEFDAIHASPPCHDHTPLSAITGENGTGHLLDDTRKALVGYPLTVIENTPGAAMRVDLMLCGGMFGLRTYRHRWFEIVGPLLLGRPSHPAHRTPTDDHKRRTGWNAGMHTTVTGNVTLDIASEALGIDWMDVEGLPQAIPPAYTEFIGHQLMDQLKESAA